MVVPCARPRLAVLAGSAGSAALCERAPRQQQQPARPWLLRATSRRAAARLLPAAAAASASSAGRGPVELLLDAVPGKSDLLSPKLDPELRQRAEKAITQRGGRVTIGDVASSAGLGLNQAEEAVRALAADCGATLQVSAEGEIVWVFPSGFQDTIRNKSLLLRLEPTLAGIKSGAEYLARVAFGTALIVSVVAVYTAIMVIATSSSKDERRSNNNSSSFGGGGGGALRMFNATDMLWYWDPFYSRHRRERMQQQPQGMNFLEAIFSWVFGDGDPNANFDRERWQAVGRFIQAQGGTVAAEELAPFLDLQQGQLASDRGRLAVDESYMLPVLGRFNGSPQVDSQGNIVYTFPDLQQTATAARRQAPLRGVTLEKLWELTAASAGQKLAAVALGAVNIVGIGYLSLLLVEPSNQLALIQGGLGWVGAVMPFLQAYAVAFFAVPALRSVLNAARNRAIAVRNEAREAALRLLQQPDQVLRQKLATARAQGQRNVISERDAIFRSDRPLEQQPTDIEADNFDAKLERRARERQQQGARRQAPPPPQQQEAAPQWWLDQKARQQQKDRR